MDFEIIVVKERSSEDANAVVLNESCTQVVLRIGVRIRNVPGGQPATISQEGLA
jgi:hypothetical protein